RDRHLICSVRNDSIEKGAKSGRAMGAGCAGRGQRCWALRPRGAGEAMSWVLLAIVGYVLLQFAIGTWVSRSMASAGDYILAGRSLGPGLVVFSVFATYFGAEAVVASGGAVYERGLAGAFVDPLSYAAAIVLVGLLFARTLWSRGLTTFAELFRQRYSPG